MINERKACLEHIVSVVHKMDNTEVSTAGMPVITMEALSETTEAVYSLTQQVVDMIEEWKKLAPWTNKFLMDGQEYTETIHYEMELFERMLQ